MVADGRYAAAMPIYEFACRACGASFEELVGIADERSPDCPACAAPGAERLLSTFQRIKPKGGTPAFAAMPGGHGGCCGGACAH